MHVDVTVPSPKTAGSKIKREEFKKCVFNTAMNETKMNWENKDGSIQWKHFGMMVGGLWEREGWKER